MYEWQIICRGMFPLQFRWILQFIYRMISWIDYGVRSNDNRDNTVSRKIFLFFLFLFFIQQFLLQFYSSNQFTKGKRSHLFIIQ